jgi:hypothetical protein
MAAKIDIAEFERRIDPYRSAATDGIYNVGNSFNNPGSSVVPGGSFSNLVSGDVPNVGTGFADSAYASMLDVPSQYGVPHNVANTFIQYSYPIVPFKDGSEERIAEFQCVFINRHHDAKHNMYAVVNIGKFNNLLRDAHLEFEKDVDDGYGEAIQLRDFLIAHGEAPLERYHILKHSGTQPELAKLERDYPNVGAAYAIAMKDVYCYQTRMGILHRWNFLGVVLSRQQATSLMAIDLTPSTSHVNVINVVQGERARTANIFGQHGDVIAGGKVWFILKRVKKEDGTYGHFQVSTYATNKRETVPYTLRYYKTNGNDELAHCWKVGTVTDWGPSSPAEGMRQRALGMDNHKERSASEATAQLPHIYIQLGI